MATQLKVEFAQCWTGSRSWYSTKCLYSKNGYSAQGWVPPVLDWFHIPVFDRMSPFKEWLLGSRLSSPNARLVPHPGTRPDVSTLQENVCCLGKNQHIFPSISGTSHISWWTGHAGSVSVKYPLANHRSHLWNCWMWWKITQEIMIKSPHTCQEIQLKS